jgi:catechol 2,3-dioxygenase-like lactoylglutathione lyase family enzyme
MSVVRAIDFAVPNQSVPRTTGIDHVGLTVPDLDASVGFFVEALGWQQIGGDPTYPAVYVSDGHTKVTLWAAWSDSPVPADREKNIGLHHLAFRVGDRAALDEAYQAAVRFPGVTSEFAPRLNPPDVGPRSHCIVFEPGGNRIEFVHYPR